MSAPVSVVIPCYCCAETIARAVESVVHQSLRPAEIVMVDDGSDDGGATQRALNDLQSRYRDQIALQVIRLKRNRGPAAARNAGIDASAQEFVAFLDADDAWHPRKLEIQHRWMREHPQAVLTGHRTTVASVPGPWGELPVTWKARAVRAYQMLLRNRLPTRTVMMRRSLPHRFDPRKRYAEDYQLWLQIVLDGHSVWLIDVPLAYSYKPDFGGTGLTGRLWEMERGEIATYSHFYRNRKISGPVFVIAVCFSLIRFVRRVALSGFMRMRRVETSTGQPPIG